MICKYCHEKNHLIDNCPNIICKKCNKQGHPQWLCSDKKYDKKIKNNFDNNLINKSNFERNNKNSNKNSNNSIDKNIINTIVKEEKNIAYYLKFEKESWGNIIISD
jgi:hypothetical protein